LSTSDVSIHAPAGGATERGEEERERRKFQSTRPRGARQCDPAAVAKECMFQSTRPRGARRYKIAFKPARSCFNPRARGGRDLGASSTGIAVFVSIHAPAGGATFRLCCSCFKFHCFNPRARGGRDFEVEKVPQWVAVSIHAPAFSLLSSPPVSIHAPAGGAT